MRVMILLAGLLLLAAPLSAETYSWTDDKGTMNFTEDLSEVPKKYRKKMRSRDDSRQQAPLPQPAAAAEPVKSRVEGQEPSKTFPSEKSYGGKSLDAWRQELTAAEAELKRLDLKVKELGVKVKESGDYYVSRSQVEVRQQYNDAAEEFNRASAGYDDLVRSARSAGVPL